MRGLWSSYPTEAAAGAPPPPAAKICGVVCRRLSGTQISLVLDISAAGAE